MKKRLSTVLSLLCLVLLLNGSITFGDSAENQTDDTMATTESAIENTDNASVNSTEAQETTDTEDPATAVFSKGNKKTQKAMRLSDTVSTVEALESAVNDASENSVITLDGSFPTQLDRDIVLNIKHDHNITIDGGGIEIKPATGKRHFSISKSGGTTGLLKMTNFKLTGFNTLSSDQLTIGAAGGGVQVSGNAQEYKFVDTTFTKINGSAIVPATASSVVLESSTFTHNYSSTSGGAFNADNGVASLKVKDCTFDGNMSNGTGYSGGAINLKYGNELIVDNSIFLNNSTKHLGGAISFHVPKANATMSINQCYFEGNQTLDPGNAAYGPWADGGAIGFYSDSGPHNFSLSNSTFYNNSSYDDGGALLLQNWNHASSTNQITNNTFFQNTGWGLGISAAPKADPAGGAIQFSKGTIATLEHNTVVGNKSSGKNAEMNNWGGARGGGISYHYDTGGAKVYPELSMKNNVLLGNYVTNENDNRIDSDYANITITKLHDDSAAGKLNDLGGNIGIDNGTSLPADHTAANAFGKASPALLNNYSNITAGNPNESGNTTYHKVIPTLPVLPNDDNIVKGLVNNTGVSTQLNSDQRGFSRIADTPDIGSVEVLWTKFNANGGQWEGLSDLNFNGTKYYEKDNGGIADNYFDVKAAGMNVDMPADPTRDNYDFAGWYEDSTLQNKWTQAGAITSANKEVYAKWTPLRATEYTVSYVAGSHGTVQPPATETVNSGDSPVSIPDTIPDNGYRFVKWTLDNAVKANADINSSGNTFTAGTEIPAGTMLSGDDLKQVIVTQDLEATAKFAALPSELSIEKKLLSDPASVYHGTKLKYQITIKNSGQGFAKNIVAVDKPAGLDFNSWDKQDGISYDKSKISWTISSIAPGQSINIVYYMTVRMDAETVSNAVLLKEDTDGTVIDDKEVPPIDVKPGPGENTTKPDATTKPRDITGAKTGDDSNLALWIALAGLGATVATFTLYRKRERNK